MGVNATSVQRVSLDLSLVNGTAWRDLDAVARAIYVDISKYYVGSNNGRISYSVRQAADELRISPATASRALARLQRHGFIVPVNKGAFEHKSGSATKWRLTQFPCDVTSTVYGSKDYEQWGTAPMAQRSNRISRLTREVGDLGKILTGLRRKTR